MTLGQTITFTDHGRTRTGMVFAASSRNSSTGQWFVAPDAPTILPTGEEYAVLVDCRKRRNREREPFAVETFYRARVSASAVA